MKGFSFEDLNGKVAVVTGGAGVIGRAICQALAAVGVKTVILDLNQEQADKVASDLSSESGTIVKGVGANVLERTSLEVAREEILKEFGSIDILINGAGGNHPTATAQLEQLETAKPEDLKASFFGLDTDGFDKVFALNFKGTVLPSQVFGEEMAKNGAGVILNISSMNSYRPLTKIPAYSAAKASINNFTQWLAVHLAPRGIRVNAIAPGFFLTNQNRFLLVDAESGKATPRGEKILSNTPMGKYGKPQDLQGTTLFLLSNLSEFLTGVVIPVDGGYSAFGGV